ncbi:MAG: DNA repair protein RecO [Patescibacteria group bacterium]
MTTYYKTQGFVFKKEDNLDTNKVFSVFTKDFGRIEVLGRAIRKVNSKLRGGIEIFSLSSIEFIQGRKKKTLTDTMFIEKFKNIFLDREKLEIACKISEVFDNFIKGEESDEKIWNLLVDVFEKLNQCHLKADHCQMMYHYFFWNFISVLGYTPELLHCASCSKKLNPYELYFSNKEGGVVCKSCYFQKRDGIKIKSDTVKILRLMLKKEWVILSKIRVEDNMQKALKEVSGSYYKYLGADEYKSV